MSDPNAHMPGTEGAEQPGVEYVILNDDVLTSVYNASNVLVQGNDMERLAVLFQFPQFLEHCPADTLDHMVPEICKNVVQWPDNSKMAAAEALYFATAAVISAPVAKIVARSSLAVLDVMGSGDIFDAWGEILSLVTPQVAEKDVAELDLVRVTLKRSEAAAVDSRRLAARLMGSLADIFTPAEVVERYLFKAVMLCDDVDSSVRAMAAQSLANIGIKLPLDAVIAQYWNKLFELVGDNNARVKAAAVRAIARTAEAHKEEGARGGAFEDMYRTMLLPLFIERCEDATNVAAKDLRDVDDDTYLMLEIFAEVYGYFLVALSSLFGDEDVWTVAVNSLRRMVTCNGPTVRHWCAFNLPAVAACCGEKKPDRMKGVVQALATDTDVETRATLASGVHELTKLVGNSELRAELVSGLSELLTDSNPQVRMNALNHLADIMEMLTAESPKPVAKQMGKVFSNLDIIAQDSWRTQKLLAEQLDRATPLIPQDILSDNVAPVLFRMARESTYQVRRSAITTIIRVLRYVSATGKRDRIVNHFIKEWAQGKVYWTRLAYLDGADAAHRVFSSQLYMQLFAEEALKMSKDPVPNVRLSLVNVMRNTAGICAQMPLYQESLKRLTADKDPQVRESALACKVHVDATPGLSAEEQAEDEQRQAAESAFFVEPRAPSGKDSKGSLPLGGTKPPPKKSFTNLPAPLKPPISPSVVPSKFLSGDDLAQEELQMPATRAPEAEKAQPNGRATPEPKPQTGGSTAPSPPPKKSGGCCVVQ